MGRLARVVGGVAVALAAVAGLGAGLGAGPAAAKVLDAAPQGFTIENVEVVPGAPMAAWRALVDKVGLWWPDAHTWFGKAANLSIQAKAGGCFCEIEGERQVEHMRVAFVDPGRMLRMLGGLGPLQGMGLHGALDWTFEPVPEGTRITLRYRVGGYATEDLPKFAAVVDKVQAQQLGGLAAHIRQAAAKP